MVLASGGAWALSSTSNILRLTTVGTLPRRGVTGWDHATRCILGFGCVSLARDPHRVHLERAIGPRCRNRECAPRTHGVGHNPSPLTGPVPLGVSDKAIRHAATDFTTSSILTCAIVAVAEAARASAEVMNFARQVVATSTATAR
eukprot:TRINITY_DN13995_c0_g1_i1.p2 TRINITY_DN13995_c0_g1~~TRINITY_DN13995_c0_g1_i1.p2  ORF type:complete len:145 (-),score=5.68 TRINITY_DN13995_c0_g1_i1:210-644(-)